MSAKRVFNVKVLGSTIKVYVGGKVSPNQINWFAAGFASLKKAEAFHSALGRAIQILRNHSRCEAVRYAYSLGFDFPMSFVCELQRGHRSAHGGRPNKKSEHYLRWDRKGAEPDTVAKLAYFKKKKAQRRRKKAKKRK